MSASNVRFNSRLNRESTERCLSWPIELAAQPASIHGSTERALKEQTFQFRLLVEEGFNSRLNRESTERTRGERQCNRLTSFNSRLNRESTERQISHAGLLWVCASIHGSTERALKESSSLNTTWAAAVASIHGSTERALKEVIGSHTRHRVRLASIHGSTERALKGKSENRPLVRRFALQFTAQQREH